LLKKMEWEMETASRDEIQALLVLRAIVFIPVSIMELYTYCRIAVIKLQENFVLCFSSFKTDLPENNNRFIDSCISNST
jgi:hypothetical protein